MTTLWRPIGYGELQRIIEMHGLGYPPRFTAQPIFYPVLDEGYAVEIARDWNQDDEASGFAGFVTRMEIAEATAAQYAEQVVGARRHRELWVPAEELPAFNAALIRPIVVSHAFFGERFAGDRKLANRLGYPGANP